MMRQRGGIRRRIVRGTAVLAALAIAGAQTQPQTQQPDMVIRINVNLVQVDAVVTDSHDQPVTNLKASDFEILQDGKRQNITNFSYITFRPAAVSAAPAPPKGQPKGFAPPPAKLKAADVRRTVALVVDDLGLSFESIAYVRQSLKRFVDTQMQPGDLVAIIRTGSGMGALQQFTSDKRLLNAAIDRVKYNALGRVGISSFAPLGSEPDMGSDTANASLARGNEERTSIFAAGSLGAIRYVVDGLRELPGRKSLIMFSENMSLFNSDGLDERVRDSLRRLTDAANRSSVVIYTIDPRGLQVRGITAADDTRNMTVQQLSNVPMQRAEQEFRSQDGLYILAHDTGGLFLHDSNDIDGQVRKAVADSEGYYLIGYHPDSNTFDSKTGDPKFHNVSVRVKVAGLHVRTRAGFFGTSDRGRQQVAHTRMAQIQHALTSPFGSAAIHVRLTPLFSAGPNSTAYLNTMLHIDAKDLQFTDAPEGWHKAAFDLVAMTFGDNGQPIDTTDRTYTIRIRGKTYEEALKRGIVYNVAHPVKKPGAYQMRVVVRDVGTGLTGSASQFIEAPDLKKDRLTLSSVVLKEMTPEAAQATVDHPEGQLQEPNPEGSAAVRIFHPGSSLLYGYQVLNARPESVKANELEVQTRLFREGTQIYAGKPNPMPVGDQTDPKRLVAGGQLKLGPHMTPGDYTFQVIVTDKLAKEKYRTATSWMDFELK